MPWSNSLLWAELLTEEAFVTSPCVTDDIVISRLGKGSQDTQQTLRVSKKRLTIFEQPFDSSKIFGVLEIVFFTFYYQDIAIIATRKSTENFGIDTDKREWLLIQKNDRTSLVEFFNESAATLFPRTFDRIHHGSKQF